MDGGASLDLTVTPLFPREHGAYGQVAFPLIAAFGVAGPSTSGVLIAVTVIAAFLAHEPALVLLGYRGPRAKRDLRTRASRWCALSLLVALATAVGAALAIERGARWSLAVPFVPALFLLIAMLRGEEKTWHGEVATALASSGAAVPITMSAGVPPSTAWAVALPFALLFVASTLAVRAVILRVRGGGDPKATSFMRGAALSLVVGGAVALAGLEAARLAPNALIAAAPGLATAGGVALRPPSPAHLRTVGWTLVGVSVLTTVIVVLAA